MDTREKLTTSETLDETRTSNKRALIIAEESEEPEESSDDLDDNEITNTIVTNKTKSTLIESGKLFKLINLFASFHRNIKPKLNKSEDQLKIALSHFRKNNIIKEVDLLVDMEDGPIILRSIYKSSFTYSVPNKDVETRQDISVESVSVKFDNNNDRIKFLCLLEETVKNKIKEYIKNNIHLTNKNELEKSRETNIRKLDFIKNQYMSDRYQKLIEDKKVEYIFDKIEKYILSLEERIRHYKDKRDDDSVIKAVILYKPEHQNIVKHAREEERNEIIKRELLTYDEYESNNETETSTQPKRSRIATTMDDEIQESTSSSILIDSETQERFTRYIRNQDTRGSSSIKKVVSSTNQILAELVDTIEEPTENAGQTSTTTDSLRERPIPETKSIDTQTPASTGSFILRVDPAAVRYEISYSIDLGGKIVHSVLPLYANPPLPNIVHEDIQELNSQNSHNSTPENSRIEQQPLLLTVQSHLPQLNNVEISQGASPSPQL